jgi:hypothetical protein
LTGADTSEHDRLSDHDVTADLKGTDMDQNVTLADDELWGAPAPTAPSEEGKKSHARRWIAAVIGTAAIGLAAVVGANLASSSTSGLATAGGAGGPGGAGGFGGPGGRGDGGTIASIDGSTLKMTTQAGSTVSVVTSATTTVSLSSTGALSDVKVGDNVRITGTTSGTTVAADSITDSGTTALADGFAGAGRGAPPGAAAGANGAAPPAGANGLRPNGGPPTAGVVKAVGGGTFTVTTTDGTTLTATTSAATAVTLVKPGTLQALKVGDTIQVNGTTASDGTITATSIRGGALQAGR